MTDIKLIGHDDITPVGQILFDYHTLQKAIAVFSGTLKSIRVKASTNGNVKVGIYSDFSNNPTNLLASANSAVVSGWNTINISEISIVRDAYYWLAMVSDVSCISFYEATGLPVLYKEYDYDLSLPNPAGSGYDMDEYNTQVLIAGWGEESGGSPTGLTKQMLYYANMG